MIIKATLNIKALVELFGWSEDDPHYTNTIDSIDVVYAGSKDGSVWTVIKYLSDVSELPEELISFLKMTHYDREVMSNINVISETPSFIIPSNIPVYKNDDDTIYTVIDVRNGSVTYTIENTETGERETVISTELDFNRILRGTQVKIINNTNNPTLDSNFEGRTAWVSYVCPDGKMSVWNWSNSKDVTPDTFVTIGNIKLVPSLKSESFGTLKTIPEIKKEFGDAILQNSLFSDYVLAQTTIEDFDKFYIENYDSTYVKAHCPSCAESFIIRSCLVKTLSPSTSGIAYKYDDQVRVGDYVTTIKDKGQIVFTIRNKVLVRYDNSENIPVCSNYYGIGSTDATYLWHDVLDIWFVKRGKLPENNNIISDSDKAKICKLFESVNAITENSFEIGQQVEIKKFDDMLKQYGKSDNGEPKTWCRFTNKMEHLCGRTATISRITERGRVELTDWDNADDTDNFIFTTEMIKSVNKEDDETNRLSKNDIEKILEKEGYSTKQVCDDMFKANDLILFSNGCAGIVTETESGKCIMNVMNHFTDCNTVDEILKYNDNSVICILEPTRGFFKYNDLENGKFTIKYAKKPIIKSEDLEIIIGKKIRMEDC